MMAVMGLGAAFLWVNKDNLGCIFNSNSIGCGGDPCVTNPSDPSCQGGGGTGGINCNDGHSCSHRCDMGWCNSFRECCSDKSCSKCGSGGGGSGGGGSGGGSGIDCDDGWSCGDRCTKGWCNSYTKCCSKTGCGKCNTGGSSGGGSTGGGGGGSTGGGGSACGPAQTGSCYGWTACKGLKGATCCACAAAQSKCGRGACNGGSCCGCDCFKSGLAQVLTGLGSDQVVSMPYAPGYMPEPYSADEIYPLNTSYAGQAGPFGDYRYVQTVRLPPPMFAGRVRHYR